jgi:uncharacterized protein YfdQ (DUF2303 family)
VINPGEFDAYRSIPLYREGIANLSDLKSFVEYTNTFKEDGSAVFADDERTAPSIVTVFDYHRPGDGGQRFGRHRATHAMPLSDEWQAWHAYNGKSLTMQNFARFLEDHIVDVLPSGLIQLSAEQERFVDALGGVDRIAEPAKLMELATGLRIFEAGEVAQATNLQSGEGEIVMRSQHNDASGGKLVVPSMFVIAVPVFKSGPSYQIIVRLRYRKDGGITFIYELWRDDLVFDHAFNEAVETVREGTSLATYRGTPSI